jgi:DNA-binding NtrC family response regulator
MPKKILVVDDEESIRWSLSQNLKLLGCDADTAASGEIALGMIHGTFYNVIITDYQMPGINGAELIKIIRGLSPKSGVILMTGLDDERLKHGSGAGIFLKKPFTKETLEKALDRLDGGMTKAP